MPTFTAQRGQGHSLSCCNGHPTIRACPCLGTCWTLSKPPGMAMWWSSRTPGDATPPRASSTPSGTTSTMATTPSSGPPLSPGPRARWGCTATPTWAPPSGRRPSHARPIWRPSPPESPPLTTTRGGPTRAGPSSWASTSPGRWETSPWRTSRASPPGSQYPRTAGEAGPGG